MAFNKREQKTARRDAAVNEQMTRYATHEDSDRLSRHLNSLPAEERDATMQALSRHEARMKAAGKPGW